MIDSFEISLQQSLTSGLIVEFSLLERLFFILLGWQWAWFDQTSSTVDTDA